MDKHSSLFCHIVSEIDEMLQLVDAKSEYQSGLMQY
jgi:hypothetical protein